MSLAHDFLADVPVGQLPARIAIAPEILTFLQYVFIDSHQGHQANALPVGAYRGHRVALEKAETAGAVKVVTSKKSQKRFWLLTESGKDALRKFRNV